MTTFAKTLIACTLAIAPLAATAQSSDAAYCQALIKAYRASVPETASPDAIVPTAIAKCNAGDIVWVRGGLEEPGRLEKVAVSLPPDIRLEAAPEGATLSQLLGDGAIDGIISPRAPSVHEKGSANVDWLFDDPTEAAKDYYRRTGIFPIMHLVGVKRELADRHPWLPAAVLKAFTAAKAMSAAHLADTSATKVMLPFVEERLGEARALMGPDFWSYGLAPNRHVLDAFLRHHHDDGLSQRLVGADELFHPSTHRTVKFRRLTLSDFNSDSSPP